MSTLLSVVLAQVVCQNLTLLSTRRFLLEYLLIAMPTVFMQTVGSDYIELYCLLAVALLVLLLGYQGHWRRVAAGARSHCYQIDDRCSVFTVLRSTAYLCTSSVILAVDFGVFPFEWRKTRRYGSTLMDAGIGIFVMTMGIVSRRVKNLSDMKRVVKIVALWLICGMLRNFTLPLFGYEKDVHEYGVHFNAFICMGLTKLLGSLLSWLAHSDNHLFPMAFVLVVMHQTLLSWGLGDFVMSNADRDTFFTANREGLTSLPGSIALYMLGVWGGLWYKKRKKLNHRQFLAKLRFMAFICVSFWLLVVVCAYSVDIARVLFNAGYVFWMYALGSLLLLTISFLIEFCLMVPDVRIGDSLNDAKAMPVPVFMEMINFNGLTYFLIANIFTGLVNLILSPEDRTDEECVLILMVHLFLTCGIIYILFRKGIRLG